MFRLAFAEVVQQTGSPHHIRIDCHACCKEYVCDPAGDFGDPSRMAYDRLGRAVICQQDFALGGRGNVAASRKRLKRVEVGWRVDVEMDGLVRDRNIDARRFVCEKKSSKWSRCAARGLLQNGASDKRGMAPALIKRGIEDAAGMVVKSRGKLANGARPDEGYIGGEDEW